MTLDINQKGVIDPISLIAVSFLLVVLGTTTSLVFKNQNINEKAACMDECRQNSGGQVCNCSLPACCF